MILSLQWRHNEQDGVSTHQPHDCLLNCLFSRRSKKTSKLRVTGLCEGNSLVTGEFPTQRVSNVENVSIWWHHHVKFYSNLPFPYHYMESLGQNELKYFGEPCPCPGIIQLWYIYGNNNIGSLLTNQDKLNWCWITEVEMSSFWWNFHHWLHWKLSKWQLPVQPAMKISSKWRHLHFSVWQQHSFLPTETC